MTAEPPIILAAQSQDPYLEPDQPVLLHANGNLSCGPVVVKYDSKHRHYREQYQLIARYLRAKGRPFDVSDIRDPSVYDVIDQMQSERRDSITLQELLDIFVREHNIHLIKTSMITRIRRYANGRWWREHNAASQVGDREKVSTMEAEFKARRQLANRLINGCSDNTR